MFLLSTKNTLKRWAGEIVREQSGAVEERVRMQTEAFWNRGVLLIQAQKHKKKKPNKTWHMCLGIQDQIKQAGLKLGLHRGFFHP